MTTELTDDQIRDVFLANGFTIKDGQTDLKPYVYAAARALLALQANRGEVIMSTITRDDIIRMAEEAGIDFQCNIGIGGRENISTCGSQSIQKITRLVELAMAAGAAAEREACARICDTTPPEPFRPSIEAAHAIRARGAK